MVRGQLMLYRTDDATRWGTGKGANLTPVEVDGNFWELAERLVALETGGDSPNGISNIAVSGSQMTVYLDDGTALGPYTLPTAMIRYRGDWASGATYAELDLVAVPDAGIYLVLRDHTAAATFDANAQDAQGNQLYRYLFPMGAADTLAALTDVDLATTAPVDGDVLGFDATTAAWIPRAPTGGLADAPDDGATYGRLNGAWSAIDTVVDWADIPDKPATIDAIPAVIGSAGQILKVQADGTIAWAADEAGSGGTAGVLHDLSDVTLTTPAAGQLLRYDGADWVNGAVDWTEVGGKPATFPPSVHTHASADVSDFAEAVDDRVAALLVAGANITLTYDDAAGSFTIDAAGSGAAAFLDLTDTPAAYGSAGQVVAVNATGDGLVFSDPASGSASALDDLGDVTITTPAAAQVLRHDGAAWVNAAVAWADIADPPTTFPPDAHTHPWGEVTDRPATVDALPGAVGSDGQVMKAQADGSIAWTAQAGGLADAPADGNLYGRQDGAWTIVPTEGAYTHWRLRYTNEDQYLYAGSNYISEIEFRETAGVSETAAGGSIVRQGSWSRPGDAFDGSFSLSGGAYSNDPFTDNYIGYQFPNPKLVKEIVVFNHSGADAPPKNYVIEASNDGVTYDLVATVVDGPVSTRTFPVELPSETPGWENVKNKPATVDALPAAVGSGGQVIKVQPDGSLAWGANEGGLTYSIEQPAAYRYFRANVVNWADNQTALASLDLWPESERTMPSRASETSNYQSTTDFWTDGDDGTASYVSSFGTAVEITFDFGTEVRLSRLRMLPHPGRDIGEAPRRINSVEVSQDGTNWTTVFGSLEIGGGWTSGVERIWALNVPQETIDGSLSLNADPARNAEKVLAIGSAGDDVVPMDAATARAALGLGSIATQEATSVSVTDLAVDGAVTQRPLSADPPDPSAGNSVMWVSDGTGTGDAGDVMLKINVGGVVKAVMLVDYSAA